MNTAADTKARYYQANKKVLDARNRAWRNKNRAWVRLREKQWLDKGANRAKALQKTYKWRRNNRAKYKVMMARIKRNRAERDPCFRFAENVKRSIRTRLRRLDYRKAHYTERLLGCTMAALRQHLESLFTPEMNWGNRGRFGWHIDHRKPIFSFNLSDPEQQRACFHFSNLQPLWWRENLEKGDKIL